MLSNSNIKFYHNLKDKSDRDWTEDFKTANETGKCECIICGKSFNAHKERIVCRNCIHSHTK